jgi:outer membrane immunogenic protein
LENSPYKFLRLRQSFSPGISMKKLILAASILAASAAGASAADLEAQPYTRASPMIAALYDWSGFYWGANAGYGSSRNCWDLVSAAGTSIGAEGCHNATGAVAGGQLGYRMQSSAWVFGVEAQGDWAGLRGSQASNAFFLSTPGDLTNRSRIDAFGLFTGQIGYAWGNTLVYVKGGAAVTSTRYNDIVTASGTNLATASDPRVGGTAGVGLEYGFAQNWSLGVVYDHLFMGSRTVAFSTLVPIGNIPAGVTVATDHIRQDVDLVTVRVNYTFGGPSIAKY